MKIKIKDGMRSRIKSTPKKQLEIENFQEIMQNELDKL